MSMCERERDRQAEVSFDMMQLPCNAYKDWIKLITHK